MVEYKDASIGCWISGGVLMLPFEFLGPYRIGEPIGRGGMGTVYRGIHEKTGDPVAVKLIGNAVADDPRFRRRFAGEIETLKRLKHPNIVSLIGYGEQSGQLFYSMELVEGESLQHRLRRDKRLTWPLVLDMAIDVCGALKHAHDFGVIHRDLKPANLLIDTTGTIKLVDFGIAKLFGNNDQTAAGSMLGTADFMAPEQAGDGAITPRTDLYALGNVLYACFAGRPPFAGRTLTRVLQSLRQENPSRLDLIDPDLPAEIVELVHDLLEKRPADRPPTALAVMNRMKAIRAGLNRQLTQLGPDADTDAPVEMPLAGPVPIDHSSQPTAVSSLDLKTLGQLDDSDLTSPRPGSSEQLTVEVTAPSGLGTASDAPSQPIAKRPAGRATVRGGEAGAIAGELKTSPAEKPVVVAASTHFQTVDEQDRRRSIWDRHDCVDPAGSHLWQILSIAAMFALLALGGGLFFWSMQKPDADTLFASIMAARESDDADRFRAQTDQFLRLYDADPRRDELMVALEEQDAYRVIRRLQLAGTREGGIEHLPPEEQAFLSAMKDRRQNPLATQQRLHQWLAIYAPKGESLANPVRSVPRQLMIRAAQLEIARLSESSLPPGDKRSDDLMARIQWGAENLTDPEQKELLEAIVGLFGDKAWAHGAVQEANRRLSQLEK